MTLRNLAAASAAVSLAVAPAVAQARSVDRAVAPVDDESELGGNPILAVAAIVAIIIGIILIADEDSVSA